MKGKIALRNLYHIAESSALEDVDKLYQEVLHELEMFEKLKSGVDFEETDTEVLRTQPYYHEEDNEVYFSVAYYVNGKHTFHSTTAKTRPTLEEVRELVEALNENNTRE